MSARAGSWDWWRGKLLGAWAALALLYLFIPIFIVVMFSFNDPKGRFNFTWEGFTLDHWKNPFAVEGLGTAAALSFVLMGVLLVIVFAYVRALGSRGLSDAVA